MTQVPTAISVVIPLYNKAAYVREAVESVLAQDTTAAEIIVVDDGSTDGGAELLRGMAPGQLRCITQANAGVSAARNRGVAEARGTIVAFLDADDRYRPGYLAAIAALVQQFPQAGMFATGYRCFWPDGRDEVRLLPPKGAIRLVSDFYRHWAELSFTCASSIAVRTLALRALDSQFPVGERLGEDQDVWFRLAESHPLAYDARPLVDYRMDVNGSATSSGSLVELLPCYLRLGERLDTGRVPQDLRHGARRLLASHYINVARSNLRQGLQREALALLRNQRARGNPVYWLRSWALALLARGRA